MYRNRSKQRRNESDEEGERAIWPLFLSVPGGRIRRRRLRSSLKYVSSGEGGNWNIGGPSTDSCDKLSSTDLCVASFCGCFWSGFSFLVYRFGQG
ncbi:unnamed protein product, partial [Arabidopsis halleri]